MTMNKHQIACGRWYKTNFGPIRHVLKVHGGDVNFFEKGKTEFGGDYDSQGRVSLDRFAADAEQEVPPPL